MEKTKWLLDTDIGNDNDDCMALAYLLHQSEIDLLGITTVTGESVRRAMLADAMCRLAGKRIPIYPGCETPILGPLLQSRVNPEEAAQTARFLHAEQFPRCRALEFLRENIEAYPHEIVLAAIGPLTNIGLLFAAYPHLPGLLKALVVMGGRFFHTADFDTKKWGHVEWNIKGDPYAASIVFSAPVPALYATGVEISCRFRIPGHRAARAVAPVPCLRPIAPVIQHWEYAWFHDPLALWAYINREKVAWARGTIQVSLGDALGAVHFSPSATGPCRVLTAADEALFFRSYAQSLGFSWP